MNNCQSIDAGTHTEKGRDDTSDELAMIKAISIPALIRGGCSGVGAPPLHRRLDRCRRSVT